MPKPFKKTRIMVFGTFDFLHKGHLNFFKQARMLAKNPYLIVSVARDVNVKKIKGRMPTVNQGQRLRAVKSIKLVDKALIGGLKKYIPHIVKERPSIIALGYDQTAYVKDLKKSLQKQGIKITIARLKAFKPHIYKSSLVKAKI